MADKIECLDEARYRVTESVSTVTEYDVPTLKKQKARLLELTAKFVTEKNAEVLEIDRILNLIAAGATP